MMTPEQQRLYQKIQDYSLDPPKVHFGFTQKLAKENAWSLDYAKQVVQEYKKFVFLAMIGLDIASPSEAVDQAWHLHLTYSRSYWEEFCPYVLGGPLHHEPSRGGQQEQQKYDRCYQSTLNHYRQYFGPPPAEIWPTAEMRSSQREQFVRIDLAKHWTVPKLPLNLKALLPPNSVISAKYQKIGLWSGLFGFSALSLQGCQVGGQPIDLTQIDGPRFLTFYILGLLFMTGLSLVLRGLIWRLTSGKSALDQDSLGLVDIAYLAHDYKGVIETGIVSFATGLDQQTTELLQSLSAEKGLMRKTELKVYETIYKDAGLENSTNAQEYSIYETWKRLNNLDLLFKPNQVWLIKLSSLIPLIGLLGIGLFRLGLGVSREKPIGFLLILLVITVGLGIWLYLRPLRQRYSAQKYLKTLAKNRDAAANSLGIPPTVLDCALLGVSSVNKIPEFADAFKKYGVSDPHWNIPRSRSRGSGSGSAVTFLGGGCGGDGGGSSGGSSCGGGCGGGGCGGCGN